MSRDIGLFIDDILESIEKIERYTFSIDESEFQSDSEKQDAILRRMEVIGEATKNLPNEFRQKYPRVPWQKLAGLRDVVIHHYYGVTLGLIWRFATSDLQYVKEEIIRIKEAEKL